MGQAESEDVICNGACRACGTAWLSCAAAVAGGQPCCTSCHCRRRVVLESFKKSVRREQEELRQRRAQAEAWSQRRAQAEAWSQRLQRPSYCPGCGSARYGRLCWNPECGMSVHALTSGGWQTGQGFIDTVGEAAP